MPSDESAKQSEKYIGQIWQLPSSQLVIVEDVRDDFAAVRMIKGERANTVAVCRVSELQPTA